MKPTREAFLAVYRYALSDPENGHPWARDLAKLENYMASVAATVSGERNSWNADGDLAFWAFREIGCKGRYTLEALRALPVESVTP